MTTCACACAKKERLVRSDDRYDEFLSAIQAWFGEIPVGSPVFTTDATDLWEKFLDGFEGDWRQYFNCTACRRFVQTYGGLVTMDECGVREPAVWPQVESVPPLYFSAVRAARKEIQRSKITGVFLSPHIEWGQPVTWEWHHMAVRVPATMPWTGHLETAGQAMAAKLQEYEMLRRALAEFKVEVVEQAATLLRSDSMYRSEKVLGVAEWLLGLMASLGGVRNKKVQDNLVWQAVAKAPPGFCHVRTTMICTLLEDLAAGLDFETVSARFRAKMSPLLYQRPQAAPKAGNIAAAEKVVEQLRAAGSLERRYATLADLQTIWTPRDEKPKKSGGVFDGVKARGAQAKAGTVSVSSAAITWIKFRDTVLGNAERIEYIPAGSGNFLAFVTAVNPDAPPILQWDSLEARNPVSWYVYHNGSPASQWNLSAGVGCHVLGVVLQPNLWGGKCLHQGESATFVLENCYDSRDADLALFPEILLSEFHGIRSVIEAYSRNGKLPRCEQPACGICVGKAGAAGEFRVTTGNVVSNYRIDRWD